MQFFAISLWQFCDKILELLLQNSGTSRGENLNPHGFNSVWTNPQPFSVVGSPDNQEHVPKVMRNFRFQNSEVLPPVEGVAVVILLSKKGFRETRLYKPHLIQLFCDCQLLSS